MKLFETIESKWCHHCDAGMPELLNYFATAGDEVVTTKRKLYEEVNRRIPYKGVVISDRQIQKNIDLLLEGNYIKKTIEGTGPGARTIYTRGSGKGTQKKKTDAVDFEILVGWYNQRIAINGRPQWLKVTSKEKSNILKCQRIANEHGTTIGKTLNKVVSSTYLMNWNKLGHFWIFMEDNFIKILDGLYDDDNNAGAARLPRMQTGSTSQREAEYIAAHHAAQRAQSSFDAEKRKKQMQASLGLFGSSPDD